jgi:hypothetical protein
MNLVRHVQRGRGRRSTVAAIGSLTAASDGSGATRFEIEPADALIVEIAEIQRPIGPDRQPVGIVHFAVRIASRPRADERGHRRIRRRQR